MQKNITPSGADKKRTGNRNHLHLNSLLQKRNREQACLYRISNLEGHRSVESLLKQAVAILPEGWQYPDDAAAAITFDGQTYATPNFVNTSPCMKAVKEIRADASLAAKIVYPDKDAAESELFLLEEEALLDAVLNHLALRLDQIITEKEMQEKQRLLDKAYQLARIGSWEFDMQTHELTWSPVTKEVHGFGADYQPDVESTINLFKEGEHRETFARAAYDAIEHEKPFDVELKIISGQGDERWIRATGEPEYNDDGVCTRFYGVSQNVTARRQAEEDLQLRERRFKSMVQDGADMIAILDSEANYQYVSPTSEPILGIPAEDFIGTNAFDYIHEDDRAEIAELLEDLAEEQRIDIPPYRFVNAEGRWRWLETTLTDMTKDPAVGGLVANSRDVTRQIIQRQKNMDALKEKETLLAEIHHRVKNNLAVVSGMMQLQAAEEQNQDIKDRLFDGIVRIQTMANIHEQLYQSNSFSKMEFDENIKTLVTSILKTFRTGTDITVDFNCEDVELNINQAIPCSLVVNEVITNACKHAFPGRDKGRIAIGLEQQGDDRHIHLSITDNGVGLPDDIAKRESSSLGLNLIDVLTKQLEAEYTYQAADNGTTFHITFEKDEQKGIGNHFM